MLGFWKNKKRLRIISILAVVGCGLVAGGIKWKSQPISYQFAADAKDGGYVMQGVVYQELLEKIEPNYFGIQVNTRPDVKNGRCNLMIGNPAENEQNVSISLILDETGEAVYRSQVLKPGEREAYVNLEQDLALGTHECTVVFAIMDDAETEAGKIEVAIIVTVSS